MYNQTMRNREYKYRYTTDPKTETPTGILTRQAGIWLRRRFTSLKNSNEVVNIYVSVEKNEALGLLD